MPPLTPPPVTAAPRRVVRSFTFNDFVALRAFVFLAIVASLTLGLDFGCGIVTDRWRRPQWTERRRMRASGRETSEERRQRQVERRVRLHAWDVAGTAHHREVVAKPQPPQVTIHPADRRR